MKTKSEISGHIIRSGAWAVFFLVAFIARFLLFIAMPAAALAVDAVWNTNPSSSLWNDDLNWTPATAPVHAGDTATFNTSNVTSLQLSGGVTIDSMTFNAGASAFSIDPAGNSFSVAGAGILNSSGTKQTITNEAGSTTNFLNSSTAANASITSVDGGTINFYNSSTAGNAGLRAAGGEDFNNTSGGSISFFDTSTADNAGLVAGGGVGAGGGGISFSGNSTAGSGTLIAQGGQGGFYFPRGGGSAISFSENSTAGNATLTAQMEYVAGESRIFFSGNSSAGNATLMVEGASDGGPIQIPSVISFSGNSTAGNATITSEGNWVYAPGGLTQFSENSSAGNATLIAQDGSGYPGGTISFADQSTGGTASVQVFGNGELDINHSVTLDSIIITSNLPGVINLAFTGPPSVIRSLVVNGVAQPSGVYGSPTSGAPLQLPQFAGPGTVQVGIIATNAASNLTSSSATLNGTVNPNGLTTNVHFQYGTTTSYGSTTASHTYTGGTTQAVSANIAGLSPNTTYHFRLVGINNGGTTYGSDRTFTTLTPTGAPVVITNPATNVANSSATLNGSLDPHGLTTTVYFQYGPTTNYGRTTPSQTQTGNTYRNINANINGLLANTVYHFRIVATNSAGARYGADRVFTPGPNDFNNDGDPDYLLFNPTTRGTVISWYMNNNVHVGAIYGPTLPAGWEVVSVADFNLDSHPDYLLFNPTTRGTLIWYMNNNVHISGNHGPAVPTGWSVVAVADFNGDGHPDYLLFNEATRATVIWYMNNNVHISGNHGPAVPTGWSVVAVADFNGDGHPDYLLFNEATRATVIWYMNNNVHISGNHGPAVPTGWNVVGAADFNGNGHPDYLLLNPATLHTVIWYMNNNIHVTGANGPTLPAGWSVVAP